MKHTLRRLGLLAALPLLAATAFSGCTTGAGEPASVAAPRTDEHLVKVTINGMVCNFCATNLDKTFEKTPGVTGVHVNLAAGAVLLRVTTPASPDDAAIRRTVDDAGFEVRAIERTDGDFDATRAALKEASKMKS